MDRMKKTGAPVFSLYLKTLNKTYAIKKDVIHSTSFFCYLDMIALH